MNSDNVPDAPIAAPWDGDDVTQDSIHDQDDEDEEVDDDSPPEHSQVNGLLPPVDRLPPSKQTYICPVVQPVLTRLFVLLATHLPSTASDGKWFNLFLPFLVIASIRAKGEFIPSGQITQIIAAIVFLLRLTMFNIMDSHVDLNPAERYEACVYLSASYCQYY